MREEIIGDCRLILGDCAEALRGLPVHDALVTDPPYGIGEAAGNAKTRTTGFSPRVKGAYQVDYGDDAWDDEPIPAELMAACRAAAKWNVIFGGNYYALPPTSCWLVWDKLNGDTDFADCELAWTNLPKAVRRIRYLWNGCMRANGEKRGDHPTQKPVGVMAWALQQLPKDARTVIDPFMGSGTTGVACVKAGLSFTGIEREPKYFEAACRRISEAYAQPRLFETVVEPAPVQEALAL